MPHRVGTNYRRSFRKAISLKYRHTDSTIIPLEFDIQKGASANEELDSSSETLSHLGEHQLVDDRIDRLSPPHLPARLAGIVILPVICFGILDTELIEFLHKRPALLDGTVKTLLKVP